MPDEYSTPNRSLGGRLAAGTSGDEPRRLRQNSASAVAVQQIGNLGGRPALGLRTPVGMTLLVLGSWIMATAFGVFPEVAEKVGLMIASVFAVLVLSAVHELGHVIAGRFVGLELRSYTVGPFALVRGPRGLSMTLNGEWIRFAGCVEHDLPPGRLSRGRLSISALGGPAANLLLAALLVYAGSVDPIARTMALWSFIFGAINLMPLRVNGQTSDGGLVWRLWSPSAKNVAWRRMMEND